MDSSATLAPPVDLLRALGRPDAAAIADRLAVERTANPAERAVLQERAGC